MPVAVIGALLGYVYNIVAVIYDPLKEYMPVHTAYGLTLLFLIAVAILLILCFLFGLAARRAFGRKFSQAIEKQLVMVFPKYAIYKDIVAGNIGGETLTPSLIPVTVRLDDMTRIGYESGRTESELVIVYLPGSPDPWIGSVALVEPNRIQKLDTDFNETAAICERLGRNSEELLSSVNRSSPAVETRREER
ncbi:DUF502 domain-containing protein [Adhaeretor mobilis]|uniref:DUF502 domain-containing protein n=1 Tax=Adhaeretor mobilis TaxID=1930276 RepID=A0A517MUA7_9BACT|nr:DUF502 domain-containing protein [Adhaeretor mobilis]QDS98465.1 hypothetical protein HG15A2_17450 [Adhaeretor mobilis]